MIDQHKHRLAITLPRQPMWLYVDASRVKQVLVNMLSNAAKFTKDGGSISLTVQGEGSVCVLRLRDTGVGIAPDLLPHIFELFTQAERVLTRPQSGLGIGLYLARNVVELHKGTVEVHSVLGHGAEFVVRLPVISAAPRPPSQVMKTGQPVQRALRLLVVDDNLDSADSYRMLLEIHGHDVRIAHDGEAALEAALEHRPNVVLLDIGLPGVSGLEVAKRLRRQPAFQNTVLVAMTGYGTEVDRQLSKEAGFDHHLVKPVRFVDVQRILAAATDTNVGPVDAGGA